MPATKPRPAKKAASPANKYNMGMKSNVSESDLHDLTVPSGALCQARRPGVQGLISIGLLDSLDSLSALVKTEHFDRVEGRAKPEQSPADIKAGMVAGMELIDKIALYCVLQPELKPEPDRNDPKSWDEGAETEGERKGKVPGLIYVDDVDLFDKMFIMQWAAGGSEDLETFRSGWSETLGTLQG